MKMLKERKESEEIVLYSYEIREIQCREKENDH